MPQEMLFLINKRLNDPDLSFLIGSISRRILLQTSINGRVYLDLLASNT